MTTKTLFTKPFKKLTLAEQLAAEIKELILSGALKSGAALPSESELADKYGVSRAVVRDATRMLLALGLVEVQHGKGVFVTQPQNQAFSEALKLALQRSNASAWDIEQFEMLLFPEVVALAAQDASPSELSTIRTAVHEYVETFKTIATLWEEEINLQDGDQTQLSQRLLTKFRSMIETIYQATHNKILQQLAQPLLNLRNVRNWQTADPPSPEETESAFFLSMLEAIESRDPDAARRQMRSLMQLPPEAEDAMKGTPIGEVPVIEISQATPNSAEDPVE
jgi:GntR family transcriptional repressor for pyruvate dehydrogenase complex